MALHRLLSMRVGVPDPHALGAFYDEMGLSRGASDDFTGSDGGAVVHVEEYPFRRLLEVTAGADDESHLAAAAGRLTDAGLAPTIADGVLRVVDPASQVTLRIEVAEPFHQPPVASAVDNSPGLTVRHNARAAGVFGTARPPRRLGHLVIGTPDLEGTRDLLHHGLGFKVSDDMAPIMTFLRCSTDHHNVALVASPVPMLQHYSWECDDVDHVGHSATALLRTDPARHAWGFGRHFLGSNYYWYLRDPAGSFLELYSDMDVIDDDEAWAEVQRTPVGFEHIANSWGPNLPAEFVEPDDMAALQSAWASRS
ncbi:MAG: VOC family protein [Actinobacteria bacterium]|nr:VOC family protein [Actinomycetota bacterium]